MIRVSLLALGLMVAPWPPNSTWAHSPQVVAALTITPEVKTALDTHFALVDQNGQICLRPRLPWHAVADLLRLRQLSPEVLRIDGVYEA